MKVSQFGEKLIATWMKAVTDGIEIPCGKGDKGRKLATHLRYRLYMLRSAMHKEAHELHPKTIRIKLIIATINGEYTVMSQPVDSSLDSVLDRAGVSIPDAPEVPSFEE